MPVSGRVAWVELETFHVYGEATQQFIVTTTTAGAGGGRGLVSFADFEIGAFTSGTVSDALTFTATTAGRVTAKPTVSLALTVDISTRFSRSAKVAAAGLVWLWGDNDTAQIEVFGSATQDLSLSLTTTGKTSQLGQVAEDYVLDIITQARSNFSLAQSSLALSLGIVTGARALPLDIGLYESLLSADRPLAWWGLDTADPTRDDSGHGRTLTTVGTPVTVPSLLPRGDGRTQGAVDFDGSVDAYSAAGTVYADPVSPPQFHAATAAGSTGTGLSIVSPPDVEAGDLQIVMLSHQTSTATVTGPAGWTEVITQNATSCAFSVWKRVTSADEPPTEWVWTWSTSGTSLGTMLVYRNVDPAAPVFAQVFGQTASGTQHVTTPVANPIQAHQLALWTAETTGTITANPTSVTERVHAAVDNVQIVAAEYDKATAGTSAQAASTSAATALGYCLLTFGAPQTVVDETLDVLDETLSFHAIFRPTTLTSADTLIRKHGSWGVDMSTTTLRFLFTDGGGVDRTVDGPTLAATQTYQVFVIDDGSNVNFWVDGVQTSVARPGAAGYTTNSNPVIIGGHFSGSYDLLLDGRLDEVAIWNRALSDEMVAAYWQAYSEGTFGQFIQPVDEANPVYPRAKLEIAWVSAPTDDCLVWTDVTDDLRSADPISQTRGRNFELDRFEPARIDFTLTNRDRQYDPATNPAIVPTRAIRFRAQATVDGTCYGIFFGYTEGHPLIYPALGFDAVARFSAIDPFKALALDQVLDAFVRQQELSGSRLEALLDGFPGIPFSGEPGQSEVAADDLSGANSLDHAQQVAETEGGALFCDSSGIVRFQDRHHRSRETTVRATYGVGGFKLRDIQPLIDEARLFTAAAVTPASGNVKTAVDSAQAEQHFLRTKTVTTLHASDADAQAMAEAFAIRYATPRMRVPSIDVLPAGDPDPEAAWAAVLSHEISHRIRTAIIPVGDTTTVTREHFVEGVRHTITRSAWAVSLSVSPAELEGEYAVVGRAVLGNTSGPTSTIVGW